MLDDYNNQKYFNKLNKLFIINKIPRDCYLIGKDIVNYLERGIKPTFYSDNDFFNNKIKSNSKVKRISSRDIEKGLINGQFITYKYQENSFKGEVYTKVRRNISYNIEYKNLAYDILENPSEYKFFKDKCEDLKSFLSKKEQFLNISALLDFKDYYKNIIWDLIYKDELLDFETILHYHQKNKKWLVGFSKNTLKQVISKLKRHNVKLFNILKEDYSLQESMECFLNLYFKHGNILIGWLESNSERYRKDKKNNLVEQYFQELEKEIVSPIKLEINNYRNYEIKELVTKKDLFEVGRYMNHCVGGYANKILKNRCRIFQIEGEGFKATLEIVRRKDEIIINQLYSKGNKKYYGDKIPLIANDIRKYICEHSLEKLSDVMSGNFFYGGGIVPGGRPLNFFGHARLVMINEEMPEGLIRNFFSESDFDKLSKKLEKFKYINKRNNFLTLEKNNIISKEENMIVIDSLAGVLNY